MTVDLQYQRSIGWSCIEYHMGTRTCTHLQLNLQAWKATAISSSSLTPRKPPRRQHGDPHESSSKHFYLHTCQQPSSALCTSTTSSAYPVSSSLSMGQLLDKANNFVAKKLANVKKPEATLEDVDLQNVSRECVEYTAKVSVDNPYSHSLPICEISYTFKSAGRVIVSGKMPDPGSLKAIDTTMLEVPMKVPYSILVSLARDVGADWDIDYEVDLSLTIDLPIIGDFTIPISRKGEIKFPTL